MSLPWDPLIKLTLSVSPLREVGLHACRKLDWKYPGILDRVAVLQGFSRLGESPWAPCVEPNANVKIALITFAGFFVKGQNPFRESFWTGDFDYRILHRDVPLSRLGIGRRFIDRRLALLDPNILYPVDRLRELAEQGVIKEPALNHYSFAPYCRDYQFLESGSATSVARRMRYEGVDRALVIPSSVGNQEMAVRIQRVIESEGISTVSLLYTMEAASQLRPPRACVLTKARSLHRYEEFLDKGRQSAMLVKLLEQFKERQPHYAFPTLD